MKNEKTTIKKFRFESLASIILLLVFILVVITGALSFVRLNNIIYTVNSTIRPDSRLILVKEIYSDIIQAENNVKSYSLTRNEEDMTRFYELTELSSGKMEDLKEQVKNDKVISPFVDSLEILVGEKFTILDQLLVNQDEFQVQKAMDQVMQNIEIRKPPPEILPEEPAMNPDTNTLTEENPVKKDNFFTRLFKKKKTQNMPPLDTLTPAAPVVSKEPAADVVTVDEISQELKKAQLNALAEEKYSRERELELFRQDKAVMEKIRKLLTALEASEADKLKENTRIAKKDASEVKLIIFSFGAASLLLLILAATVIFIYIKRNKEYRLILKKAKNDAEELAHAKERFLANMSHEIKTPMNIISGYLGQILQTPLNPAQHEHIEIVKKSADHLLQLLNNLLDLSRLQADKLEIIESDFSPADLINDMQRWFSQAAGEKNLQLLAEISSGIPTVVSGDPVRLRQILFNLAGNAIKFTDKGTVTIRAYPGKDSGDRTGIVFEVSDTGIGIPKEETARIFGEFEQGTSSMGQKAAGSGLGLSITAKLVEMLGGTIRVLSEPGKGSSFIVEIPFLPAKGTSQPGAISDIPDTELLNYLKVLVVDDEAYNRGLLKLILGRYKCMVTEASSGPEAISAVKDMDPDLILMDIRMPGMNGPEAVTEISKIAIERGLTIPVIAVSADISHDEMVKYRKNGFDDFLTKPFKEEHLLKAIISLVKNHQIHALKSTNQITPDPILFDLDPLRESCAGNEAFFMEMVQMFLESTDSGLSQMNGLLQKEEWENVAELAHKISAPCRHLKAEKLYSLLKLVEQQLTTGSRDKSVSESIRQARDEFERIRAGILAQLDTKSN